VVERAAYKPNPGNGKSNLGSSIISAQVQSIFAQADVSIVGIIKWVISCARSNGIIGFYFGR
jgi:hypothetical protein